MSTRRRDPWPVALYWGHLALRSNGRVQRSTRAPFLISTYRGISINHQAAVSRGGFGFGNSRNSYYKSALKLCIAWKEVKLGFTGLNQVQLAFFLLQCACHLFSICFPFVFHLFANCLPTACRLSKTACQLPAICLPFACHLIVTCLLFVCHLSEI